MTKEERRLPTEEEKLTICKAACDGADFCAAEMR